MHCPFLREHVCVQCSQLYLLFVPLHCVLSYQSTGELVTSEELGGASVHCETSGVADHLAENEPDALRITRNIVANLNRKEAPGSAFSADALRGVGTSWNEPLFDPSELGGILPVDVKKSFDVRRVIARILDGSRFAEFKQNYGRTIVTGFGEIYGQQCGIIANNGILFSESALKAAHFVELCCQRGVPILFLQVRVTIDRIYSVCLPDQIRVDLNGLSLYFIPH